MQAAKVKVKDMVSTAKEKVKEHKAKAEEKSEMRSAHTHLEKELAHEKCVAKITDAKAQLHDEKAEHRAKAQAHAAGAGGVASVVGGGHNYHTVGTGPAPIVVATPASSVATHPTGGPKIL